MRLSPERGHKLVSDHFRDAAVVVWWRRERRYSRHRNYLRRRANRRQIAYLSVLVAALAVAAYLVNR